MKNLLDYGVQELEATEMINIDGGYTQTRTKGKQKMIKTYSAGGDLLYTRYYENGRLIRDNGQGTFGGWAWCN